MIIRLKVFEQTLSVVDTKSVPRKGSKDYLVLHFLFSSDWKDLNKICYLQHGAVSQPIDVVDNLVEVPEWFTQQDSFDVTLFGKSGTQEVPTNVVSLRLEKSNTLWEQGAPEPQPSWLAKVIDLNNHPSIPGENGYWLIWDTDNGAYVESELPLPAVSVGPQGPQGEKGDKGDTGATGPQGEQGPAGVADISLGVTGATVGQIAKITAVDASGKPTEWEAADMASGGGETWEKISDVSLTQDVSSYILASFGSYRKIKIMMERGTYVSGLNKNVWVRISSPDKNDFYTVGYLTIEYGYLKWEINAEVNNAFISGHMIFSNNINAPANLSWKVSKELGDTAVSDLSLCLYFTDVSVIQDGDSVSVWGVRW